MPPCLSIITPQADFSPLESMLIYGSTTTFDSIYRNPCTSVPRGKPLSSTLLRNYSWAASVTVLLLCISSLSSDREIVQRYCICIGVILIRNPKTTVAVILRRSRLCSLGSESFPNQSLESPRIVILYPQSHK